MKLNFTQYLRNMRETMGFGGVEETKVNPIYSPDDDEGHNKVWMIVMIGTGISFVIFVITSLYLMWKPTEPRYRNTDNTATANNGLQKSNATTSQRLQLLQIPKPIIKKVENGNKSPSELDHEIN